MFIRSPVCVAEHMGELCFVCNGAASVASMGGQGGAVFLLFLAVITLVPMFGLTQGPYLVARTSLSRDGFQHEGSWEVGRIY